MLGKGRTVDDQCVDDPFGAWAVTALSALAHASRLQVHRLLVAAGDAGLSAGAIAAELGIPASSLSFHLAHMQAAEMVVQRREGRSLIYSVNFDCMDALMAYLQENCCKGVVHTRRTRNVR
jgi:ArsR family transcriptional regulator, arsenate/arsenite/antimonite-responsive transcriptional repressor